MLIFVILGANCLSEGLLILPLHICPEKLVDVCILQLVQLFQLLFFSQILLLVPLVEEFPHTKLLDFVVAPRVEEALLADGRSMIRSEGQIAQPQVLIFTAAVEGRDLVKVFRLIASLSLVLLFSFLVIVAFRGLGCFKVKIVITFIIAIILIAVFFVGTLIFLLLIVLVVQIIFILIMIQTSVLEFSSSLVEPLTPRLDLIVVSYNVGVCL